VNIFRVLGSWISVAEKETRANLLSPRFLALAVVLLLAVIAGVYQIAPGMGIQPTPPTRLVYGLTYYPSLNTSEPAMGVFTATPEGKPSPGVKVNLMNVTQSAGSGSRYVLETVLTNSSGWARFERLREFHPNEQLLLSLADEPGSSYSTAATTSSFPGILQDLGRLNVRTFSFGTAREGLVLTLLFTNTRGVALIGSDVYIRDRNVGVPPGSPPETTPIGGWARFSNGTTDSNGYYYRQEPLAPGEYVVRVAKGTLNATAIVSAPRGADRFGPGPDGVMALVGFLFVPLIVPLMALMLAYDAIAKERVEGSLDLLLSKPISRTSVALGKLTGVFASAALPVLLAFLSSAAILWVRTGQKPTGYFLFALLGETFYLVLAYTLVFLVISALVKNPGSALLLSVLVYLLFTVFWDVIGYVLAAVIAPPGTSGWYRAIVALAMLSPSGVYLEFLSHSGSGLLGALLGVGGGSGGVPDTWLTLSAASWLAIPLGVLLWALKYRVTET
jgi:ABC-type transport system involved in multi-copper enzyme maturation permease subunit